MCLKRDACPIGSLKNVSFAGTEWHINSVQLAHLAEACADVNTLPIARPTTKRRASYILISSQAATNFEKQNITVIRGAFFHFSGSKSE